MLSDERPDSGRAAEGVENERLSQKNAQVQAQKVESKEEGEALPSQIAKALRAQRSGVLARRWCTNYACFQHHFHHLSSLGRPVAKTQQKAFEYVEPIGARVLVRKDEAKRQTKGGIALPDQAEIPTITGRIVAISAQVEHDEDVPLRQYDKILFHPKNAIPVDFEPDNQLFVVPVEDVVAVFRREPQKPEKAS